MRTSVLLGLFVLGLVGCQSQPSNVAGAVNIDGQPVADGYITFFPQEGTKTSKGAEVKNGRYQAKDLAPGRWCVQYTAAPNVSVASANYGSPLLAMSSLENRIQAKFLVVEIRPGQQHLDLALQSERP